MNADYVVNRGLDLDTCVWMVFRCGYATLHHVVDKSKEDRMESFFLSETCKYLYLVSNMIAVWVNIMKTV